MLGFRRPLCRNPNVKTSHILASCLCFALAACGQHEAAPATAQESASDATQPAATKPARNKRLTAQDIARIEATGKTGLWAETTEICGKARASLAWNVTGQADKVALVLASSSGKQRNVGAGGAVGERVTGRWVRPGMTFKLLKAGDRTELGSVSFTEGANCRR
jgi:hypothetical protein